jgi:hypothetical protein
VAGGRVLARMDRNRRFAGRRPPPSILSKKEECGEHRVDWGRK